MRNIGSVLCVGVICFLFLIGSAAAAGSSAAAVSGNGSLGDKGNMSTLTTKDESLALPTGTPSLPTGVPAIQPTQKGIPAFTEKDALAFIQQNGVPHTLNWNTDFTISEVTFITSGEASKLLDGEDLGIPDQKLVCYAELDGSFVFPGPNGSSGTFSHAVEIFDAQTGNLLLSGGLLN